MLKDLTFGAYEVARDSEDFSLVTLAALSQDSVVLAALRETVVLYAVAMTGAAMEEEPKYVWQVDGVIEEQAQHFVRAFSELFDESLPRPQAENAEVFCNAWNDWEAIGRCVRIGFETRYQPIQHYHWAIEMDKTGELIVKDFWDTEIWTTERYRKQLLNEM